jgi:hypothetical protein
MKLLHIVVVVLVACVFVAIGRDIDEQDGLPYYAFVDSFKTNAGEGDKNARFEGIWNTLQRDSNVHARYFEDNE